MNTFDAGLQVALQIMFAVLKKLFISIIQSWRYSQIYFWCPSGPSQQVLDKSAQGRRHTSHAGVSYSFF